MSSATANIADFGHLVDDRTGRVGFVIGELAAVTDRGRSTAGAR
jgi:hypothetical protein